MLNRLHQLLGFLIEGSDGELGSVSDVYFDDHPKLNFTDVKATMLPKT